MPDCQLPKMLRPHKTMRTLVLLFTELLLYYE
jgi:hypothetical protein